MKQGGVDIWKEDFAIRSYELDLHGKVFLPVLMSHMQEAASNHVDSLGVGYADLQKHDRFWVLSRFVVEIEQYPGWGDVLCIHTWHAGEEGLHGMREFVAYNGGGKPVLNAVSAWLMLDRRRSRPCRPSELYNKLNIPVGISRITHKTEKLPRAEGGVCEQQHLVSYSDLDVNRHANSARYVEWILNSYSEEYIEKHEATRCEINFLAECGYGDHIDIVTEKTGPHRYLHTLMIEKQHIEVCRVRLLWRKGR
jgi:acyl-ACP thioesterase